jgi:sugar/nucleoside kinase (ribokinase family)
MDFVILNHIQKNTCMIEDDLLAILAHPLPHLTWNPGGCQIDAGSTSETLKQLLENTDLLMLNREEILKFTNTQTPEDAIRAILAAGCGAVCVTDGKRGVLASDGRALYHCPVLPNVKVIDTTGAGDAFCTGTTWALMHGLPLPMALRAGTINSASVVEVFGAQAGLLTESEMRQKLETMPLHVETIPLRN